MAGSKLTALADLAGAQVSTDLAYVVDVSAGVNGSKKSTLNDLFATITKNITDGAVRFQGFSAPSLSASGQAATYFDSTLNRLLLSENAGPFMPLRVNMYLDNNSNTTVANTTTETALLGAADDGSTKVITPALARVNQTFRLSFRGIFQTTGSPTLTVRLKLVGGVTTTLETYSATVTSTGTEWELELFATITAVGAGGTIVVQAGSFKYAAATAGAAQQIGRNTTGATAVDFSVNQTWELTVQWGTADPANSFTYRFGNVDIVR